MAKNAITFNMVSYAPSVEILLKVVPGPLLDDGAPYSGIGAKEFQIAHPFILPAWNGQYDPIPDSIADRPWWQYGTGSHSSAARRILGNVLIEATSNEGVPVKMRHLIIDGSLK